MKNRVFLLLSFLFISFGVFGQDRYEVRERTAHTSLNEVGKMAEDIVETAGLRANFVIMEAEVQNALAVVTNGKRYILYNPRFIDLLTRVTGTKWAAVSVLAHEIGHHLWRKSNNGKPLATELEADEFSGYVLAKMGASLDEAQAAMKVLATTRATSTHPAGADRIASIAVGWKNGGGILSDEDLARNEVRTTTNDHPLSDIPADAIAATIRFNSRPGMDYYVTKKWGVVKASNEGPKLIARMTRSTDSSYPYIIYDDTGFRLYVDRYGKIVNGDGDVVGRMKAIN